MNLDEQIKNAEKSYGGNDWFNIQEGSNLIRVMSPLFVYPSHYSKTSYKGVCFGGDKGCPGCKSGNKPSIKWLCWVIERARDEKSLDELKLTKLPHTVVKLIQTYQDDPDYAFSEFPMPYDIKIKAKNAGTIDVEYGVVPSPKREPVSEEILAKLEKQKSPEEIIVKIKEKKMKELGLIAGGSPEMGMREKIEKDHKDDYDNVPDPDF